jgi:hypothetical protein
MICKHCSLFFLFLFISSFGFAQYWNRDDYNSYVKTIKSGKGYDLVFLTGNGKNDTVKAQADAIYHYNSLPGKPRYIAKKQNSWFQLEQGREPIYITNAHTYLGNGYFLSGENPYCSVWSIEEKRMVLKKFETKTEQYPETMLNENDKGVISYYYIFEMPGITYSGVLGTYNGRAVRFGSEGLTVGNYKWTSAKAGNRTLYGIALDGLAEPVTKPVYDMIMQYPNFVFAKKKNQYDVYDVFLNLLATSDRKPQPPYYENLLQVSKGGKYGLISALGKEVLPYAYDTIFVGPIFSAVKKDSVYFFDNGKLIFKDRHVKSSVYNFTGDYCRPPGYVSQTVETAGVYNTKMLFVYNPYTKKVIDLHAYEYVYRYDVNPTDYFLCARKNEKTGIFEFYRGDVLPYEYEMIGQAALDTRVDSIHPHIVKKDGKYGVLDRHLKTLVPVEYEAVGNVAYALDLQGDGFSLKKDGKWYLYHKNAGLSKQGYDSVLVFAAYDPKNNYKKKAEMQAIQNGVRFLIDSTGRKYYDFSALTVRESGSSVILEDGSLNQPPVQLVPAATINRIEELSIEHAYAIVFCLNRYFVINKYGEMSAGFEEVPEYLDLKRNLVFGKMLKSQKAPGLYTFAGVEKGTMSKAQWARMEYDMITNEFYYLFADKKGMKGLMSADGGLLLECRYFDIGTIGRSEAGKCEVWIGKDPDPKLIDLKSLKPVKQ